MLATPVRRRRWMATLACAAAWSGVHQAQGQTEPTPLLLGVLPNVSPRRLTQQYQPLRAFLETRLSRPVLVVTAPDFNTFHARALEGQYGLYITAANLGALALADGEALALGMFEPGIPALALAPTVRSQVDAIAALRGHTLALSNPASLVALRGATWLRDKGLEEGRDYQLATAPNEDSLARWLDSGDAPLALMSGGEFNQLSDARRKTLEVIEHYATVPGFLALVPARSQPAETAVLQQAMQAFFASPALEAFSAATGVRTLREVGRAQLAMLEPYIDPTRRRMLALR